MELKDFNIGDKVIFIGTPNWIPTGAIGVIEKIDNEWGEEFDDLPLSVDFGETIGKMPFWEVDENWEPEEGEELEVDEPLGSDWPVCLHEVVKV
jgi:hypothetical protein